MQADRLVIGGVLYELAGNLGAGGFGEVRRYDASAEQEVPPGAPRSVAVKTIEIQGGGAHAVSEERIRREITNTQELPDHDNVCKTYGWEVVDPTNVRIYMEHIDGDDMLQWAQRAPAQGYDEPQLFNVFSQILAGVLHCHANGIVHRDLKADNVVIAADGTAKLIDFGLSKNVMASAAHSLVGTPAYLPPEIAGADGSTEYDAYKGDAWSLGVALYVITCREYPFGCDGEGPGTDPRAVVLERISAASWAHPGTVQFGGRLLSARLEHRSRPLAGLICRLLTIEPEDRISLHEVQEHAWFFSQGHEAEDAQNISLTPAEYLELGLEESQMRWDEVIHDLPFSDSMRDAVGMALGDTGDSAEMQLPVGVSWAPAMDLALPAPSEGAFAGACGSEPEPEPEPVEEGVPPVPVGMAVAVSYELPCVPMMLPPRGPGGFVSPGQQDEYAASVEDSIVASVVAGAVDDADYGWAIQLPEAISWVTQQSFAAAQAGNLPVPQLPVSRAGAPKPAVAWIAGAIYWVALQPRLQPITGVSVTPVTATGRPAEFVRQKMQESDPHGQAIASLIREILKACDSGIKLEGWDAVRKQLSGDRPNPVENPTAAKRKKWWQNPARGGNGRGDHSQTYTEECPYLFQVQMELFEATKPGVLQQATTQWLATFAAPGGGAMGGGGGAAGSVAVAVPPGVNAGDFLLGGGPNGRVTAGDLLPGPPSEVL